jgi:hypothetical protein
MSASTIVQANPTTQPRAGPTHIRVKANGRWYKTGSSDAARGLGGHSKDASHTPGAPAEYVEENKPAKKD